MKKTIILISVVAIFISSWSLIENFMPADPTQISPTPIPTAILDPCAPENLLDEVAKVQDLVNEFQDTMYVANFTPSTMMVVPIMEMQDVRRDLQKLDVPACEESIKTASLNYMISTINYLALFMANPDPIAEDLIANQQNSQVLWQIVLGEFDKLLTSAGLVSEEFPEMDNAALQTTDSGFLVGNDGTQRVNVRNQPDLNADIISQFEPGMLAFGLARNEAGDWLLINLNGVIGWVYTDMVTTSTGVEELPISDPVQ